VVRPWSDLEAELLQQLGSRAWGLEEAICLTEGAARLVLLLFPQRMVLANVRSQGSESSGGSSSSSKGPVQKEDILESVEGSANRIFAQLLKPVNTVVYGVQDIESKLSGSDKPSKATSSKGGTGTASSSAVRWEYAFKNLQGVIESSENGGMLKLEDRSGDVIVLPLCHSDVGPASTGALAAGLRAAAAHQEGVANWDGLRAVLREERRQQRDKSCGGQEAHRAKRGLTGGAGQRTLEVFEVERRMAFTGEWMTPFMPQDKELSWRWLDSAGYHHPHLNRKLNRQQAADLRVPPCDLDPQLFSATSNWTVSKGPDTDKDGWKYGIAWNSSTWEVKPGTFDGFRRRRWTRTYA